MSGGVKLEAAPDIRANQALVDFLAAIADIPDGNRRMELLRHAKDRIASTIDRTEEASLTENMLSRTPRGDWTGVSG